MATYQELFSLRSNSGLLNRVAVACVIAAETIRTEDPGITNHAARLVWAKATFSNPQVKAAQMWMTVLAANKDATLDQIQVVTDETLQTRVDAAVDVFTEA